MLETHKTSDTKYHLTNDLTVRRFIGEMLEFFGSLEADEDVRTIYTELFKYIAKPGAENAIGKIKLIDCLVSIKKSENYKHAMLFDFMESFFDGLKAGIKFSDLLFNSLVANTKNNALKKLGEKVYVAYAIRYIQTGKSLYYENLIADFSETFMGKKIGIDKQKSELFLATLDPYKTDIKCGHYFSLIKKAYDLPKEDSQKKEILLQVGYRLLEEQFETLRKQSKTDIYFLSYAELLKNIALLKIHIARNRGTTKRLENLEKHILKVRVKIASNFVLSAIKELEKIKHKNSGWRKWLSRQKIWRLFFRACNNFCVTAP